jgi:hypothetical protein
LGLRRQKRRQIEAEGAEAHAQALQRTAFPRTQGTNVRLDLPTIEHAELFDQMVGEAASQSSEPAIGHGRLEPSEREQAAVGLVRDETLQPPHGPLARRGGADFAV